MSAGDPKRLASLLKRLRTDETPREPPLPPNGFERSDAVLVELLHALLLWETSTSEAKAGLERLIAGVVDLNELRVCMPEEIAGFLGERYPLALERALRIRHALNAIYQREHALCLSHLKEAPKREARAFLDSLDGVPPFVAARVSLLCMGIHAVPVDERLRDLLLAEKVFREAVSVEAAARWLDHTIKADESLSTHLCLQAWSDLKGNPPRRDGKAAGERAGVGGRRGAAVKPRASRPGVGGAKGEQ